VAVSGLGGGPAHGVRREPHFHGWCRGRLEHVELDQHKLDQHVELEHHVELDQLDLELVGRWVSDYPLRPRQ
jgi:hypothetical protein